MDGVKKFIIKIIGSSPKYLLTALTLGLILWLTLARFDMDPDDMPSIPHLDKAVHFIMFGGLAWIATLDRITHLRAGVAAAVGLTAVAAALGASAAGGLIEIAQGSMTLGRSADLYDWIADTAGAATGAWIAWSMLRQQLQS